MVPFTTIQFPSDYRIPSPARHDLRVIESTSLPADASPPRWAKELVAKIPVFVRIRKEKFGPDAPWAVSISWCQMRPAQ